MNRRTPMRLEERGTSLLVGATFASSTVALGALLVRSVVRLDLSWDVFAYHLPFAALRGGIRVPFELPELLRTRFEGFPPLPHFVQGVLWRTTGSVNATGVAGMLALLLFLWFCHTGLRAPWWLVAAVALSAPLVVIHAASSYVDLFGNALLAVGAASALSVLAYPERGDLRLLTSGVLGVAGAAWSKYQLLPVAGLVWLALAFAFLLPVSAVPADRKRSRLVLLAGLLLSSGPYAVNLVAHRNPFWPMRVPVLGRFLPWVEDPGFSEIFSRPPSLAGVSQVSLFFRSLLEVGLPTSYPDRPRWVIDQGITVEHLRMGGFWWISVVAVLTLLATMAVRLERRRGLFFTGGMVGLIGFVSVLPQSHELRYYLFLPLTWGAGIGLLFPEYRRRFPRSAPLVVLLCTSLFATMAWVNRQYYRPERIGWVQAAEALGAARYWPDLSREGVNCAVRMGPRSFLLTGATLREFHVREVAVEELCPDGSTVATPEGVRPPTPRATVLSGLPSGGGSPVAREAAARRALASGLAHLAAGRYVLASERAGQAASLFPRCQEAYRVICSSRSALGEREDAMYSCAAALLLGSEDPVSRRELNAAMSRGKGTGTPAEAVRSPRDWIAAGQAAYREERFEDSVEAAGRALRKEPHLAEAWELVDAGSAAAGHREDAARAHRITLDLVNRPASPR